MRFVLAIALVACGKGGSGEIDPPAQSSARAGSAADKVTGSLAIEGKPAELRGCRVGRNVHTFVEVETSRGVVRFDEGDLSLDGQQLECQRLDRSWGGGTRTDGTSYWRGKLDVACGRVVGNVEIECGGITTAERLKLEGNRQDMLQTKRSDKVIELGPFTSAIPDGWLDVAASGDPELGTLIKPGGRALISERPAPGQRSVIVVQRIQATSKWTTCDELSRSLPPGIALTEPTLTTAAGDRTCAWKLTIEDKTGRMSMRVHREDAFIVQLLRGTDPDPDADRAFDAIVGELKAK